MPEAVRLLIWDLDDTYWKGTLKEGGIQYDQRTDSIVRTLAERGIISSICSKNDFDAVKQVLMDHDVWDYFVFPSINWMPKGQRIREIVNAVQLRPSTVMFVDDNPINLREALYYVPELQVADVSCLADLLDNSLFQGKDDRSLTRLRQYKLLERRSDDLSASGGDNIEFLRSSNIVITIDFDVEQHIERAVELINRTNQLNFTKRRLSEDLSTAITDLSTIIKKQYVQAGLIHVCDKYGDYGYVGIYVMERIGKRWRLLHFCFSCRTLNMGIEAWVYRKLARPTLHVTGEVLTNLFDEDYQVDWIEYHSLSNRKSSSTQPVNGGASVLARGGCDLAAMTHYFNLRSSSVISEFNFVRNGIPIRVDHSGMLRHAIEGMNRLATDFLAPLGYQPEDFETAITTKGSGSPIRILSCWADADVPVYRHRGTGLMIPFWIFGFAREDLTDVPMDIIRDRAARSSGADTNDTVVSNILRAVVYLKEHFDYMGVLDEEAAKENCQKIFSSISPEGPLYVILANERRNGRVNRFHANLNRWTAEVADSFSHVMTIRITDFIRSEAELFDINHFHRMVYFRLYEHIEALSTS